MTKPITKPTRSMPKIDQEPGDSIDEEVGQEEWLSDGGYTDDDTITSQDQDVTSSQDEQSNQQETILPDLQQAEETVQNINNQLQLEINIGEDGVAVIRRQAVRVAEIRGENSISPQKGSAVKELPYTEPPTDTIVSTAAQPAASTTSASEGTAEDYDNSPEDPEKLLDQLETFLIRKTDGKVLETKATVQTTLNDLVKNTVDDEDDGEQEDKGGDEVDDGNDTDDLLSVLDDSLTRRTTRSLAKLQQADSTSAAKEKASKQVTKSVETTKPGSSQRRTATRTSSLSKRNLSQDEKPVILSNKVVQLTDKTSSHKKSNSNQKSLQNKAKNTSTVSKNLGTSPKADEEVIKYFASQNLHSPQQLAKAVVKVERVEAKKPVMAISNTNFGDTYNTFIKKQSIANKKFDSLLKNSTPKKVDSPKVYKRKASTFKDTIDPFDKLLQNDDNNETNGQNAKIKRLSIDSATKSPMTKLSKLNFEANISPKVSKSSDGTTKVFTILEKNTGLSIKSSSPGNNKIQTITRKAVAELPKSQSPKVPPPKSETIKIQPPKTQSPITRTVPSNSQRVQKGTFSNVSTKIRPISPLGKKIISNHHQNTVNHNVALNKSSTIKSYSNNSRSVLNKAKNYPLSEEDRMDSDDNHEMPQWPGSDDDDEEEELEKPSETSRRPQRNQEGILKKAVPTQGKLADRDRDEGSTEFDSDEMDDSDFEDMSVSDSDSLYGDMFTIDLTDERAAEYLPLLGEKANEVLEREKRSVFQKLTTIRQGLLSLQENIKKNQKEVEMSKLKIMELNTLLRQP